MSGNLAKVVSRKPPAYSYEEYIKTKQSLQQLTANQDDQNSLISSSSLLQTHNLITATTLQVDADGSGHALGNLQRTSDLKSTSTLDGTVPMLAAVDVAFDRAATLLETSLMDALTRAGIRFTADIPLKALLAELKKLYRQSRLAPQSFQSMDKPDEPVQSSDLVRQQHEQEIRSMRQAEADLVRKMRVQHEHQLEHERVRVRDAERERLTRQLLEERDQWQAKLRVKLEADYQAIADHRASSIESKLTKLESEYVGAVRHHVSQTASVQQAPPHHMNRRAFVNDREARCRDFEAQIKTLHIDCSCLRSQCAASEQKTQQTLVQLQSTEQRRSGLEQKCVEQRMLLENCSNDREAQVAAAKLEIDLMKRRRQEELDAIDGRIRLVVAKKDAQNAQLMEKIRQLTDDAYALKNELLS